MYLAKYHQLLSLSSVEMRIGAIENSTGAVEVTIVVSVIICKYYTRLPNYFLYTLTNNS